MIQMIKAEPRLKPCLVERLYDAGIEVGIDPALSGDDFAAVKADAYYVPYAHKDMPEQPKMVDFVVAVDCECDWYVLYILELKNVKRRRGFTNAEIREKFTNALNIFLGYDFKDIFLNDRFKYRDVKLYLVSDAFHEAARYQTHEQAEVVRRRKGRDTLYIDLELQKPLKFRKKLYSIKYDIPPNPIIKRIL